MDNSRSILLKDVFGKQTIFKDLRAGNKDEAIDLLVSLWGKMYGIGEMETVLDAIRERERKMSTGIKNGIAIPHGKINGFGTTKGIIGIFPEGLDFDALDNEPVFIVFLFISDGEEQEKHLAVLRQIAELVENPLISYEGQNKTYIDQILGFFD